MEENLKLFASHSVEKNDNVLFGMDIGGTLTKMVYFEPDNPKDVESATIIRSFITSSVEYGLTGIRDEHFEYHCPQLGGKLHFIKFQTNRMEAFLQLVEDNKLVKNIQIIAATGGGAHKFEKEVQKRINVTLLKCDEMSSLIEGAHFLLTTSTNQLFHLENPNFSAEMQKVPFPLQSSNLAPYLIVNIGSGISILLVRGPSDFSRVGGSSIGGATFLALSKLLAHTNSFSEALSLANEGDSTNVDMLVRDIYGGDYAQFGLSGTTVASSFGKMIHSPPTPVAPEDFCKASLVMVTNNICSIAYLQAKVHNVDKVVFAGNFLENNSIAMRTLAFGMEFWSQNSVKALFLEHIGYSGAVGALISTAKQNTN